MGHMFQLQKTYWEQLPHEGKIGSVGCSNGAPKQLAISRAVVRLSWVRSGERWDKSSR